MSQPSQEFRIRYVSTSSTMSEWSAWNPVAIMGQAIDYFATHFLGYEVETR